MIQQNRIPAARTQRWRRCGVARAARTHIINYIILHIKFIENFKLYKLNGDKTMETFFCKKKYSTLKEQMIFLLNLLNNFKKFCIKKCSECMRVNVRKLVLLNIISWLFLINVIESEN